MALEVMLVIPTMENVENNNTIAQKTIEKPAIVYHGTVDVNIESILRYGLIPQGGKGIDQAYVDKGILTPEELQPGRIWFTTDIDLARKAAQELSESTGSPARVLEVKINESRLHRLQGFNAEPFIEGVVEPENIKVIN